MGQEWAGWAAAGLEEPRNSLLQGGCIPRGAARGDRGNRDGPCGRRHPVTWAGLEEPAAGAEGLRPLTCSPLPFCRDGFCMLKQVAFCFDEWARS